MRLIGSTFLACVLLLAGAARAEEPSAEVKQFLSGLHFKSGTVSVPRAGATLQLAPEYRYLEAHDAQKILEELWGNPPDADVLGLILPRGAESLTDEGSWAVVVTYSDDGHVSDEDAAKTDYVQMLKDMQESTRDSNKERKKQGYPTVDLVGWAAPPRYDQANNKLYWAKELAFEGNSEHTLNYDIRALGRGGYLSLNAVAPMSQLPTVEKGMQQVLGMTQFDAGHRYADFNSSTDKVAAYGLAALVAGGLAAKAGLFAKLFALLLAAKKLVFVAIAAVAGVVGKLFKRKAS
jgi:uncharacterized membrane-anchored protein